MPKQIIYIFYFTLLLLNCSTVSAVSNQPSVIADEVNGNDQSEPAKTIFNVMLDGKKIGNHSVTVKNVANGLEVRTQVELEVKILFVKVFSYVHNAHETWQDNCLQKLHTNTQSGRGSTVLEGYHTAPPNSADESSNSFTIAITQKQNEVETHNYPECSGTFAYWDLQRLNREQLINTETGELSPATLVDLGESIIPLTQTVAQSYELRTPMANIKLWYDKTKPPFKQWLALATVANKRDLLYIEKNIRIVTSE